MLAFMTILQLIRPDLSALNLKAGGLGVWIPLSWLWANSDSMDPLTFVFNLTDPPGIYSSRFLFNFLGPGGILFILNKLIYILKI
jgi:hypothetical protein